jgi:pimeloyl-ACP methyl ester carboxylesterase
MTTRRPTLVTPGLLFLLVLSLLPSAEATTPTDAAVPRFEPAACPVEFSPDVRVDCGYVVVRENRARATGRTIRLAVAILRTQSPHPKPDPILFLEGGPSFPAIDPFGFSLDYFGGTGYAADRDVILLDQRGVGSSRPVLSCPEFDRLDAATFPEGPTDAQGAAAERHCRDRLAQKADLRAYNLAESAADVRDVRVALGLPAWNVLALSAGTYVAQTAMRLFPQGIRSVILDSPLSVFAEDPAVSWRGRDHSLSLVFRGCAADPACDRAHPHLRWRFWRLVHRLRAHPQTVAVKIAGGGKLSIRIHGDDFLDESTGCAGSPQCAVTLPDTIHRAIEDGLQSIHHETIQRPQAIAGFIAQAKTFAYLCHDQLAFVTRTDLLEGARELPEYRNLILHPWWEGLCDLWHVGRADPSEYSYVHSDIPTLLLEGLHDGPSGSSLPETRRIAERVSRAFTFVFPPLGHIELLHACPRHIATHFLNRPSVRPLGSCVAGMPALDFSPPPRASGAREGTDTRFPAADLGSRYGIEDRAPWVRNAP